MRYIKGYTSGIYDMFNIGHLDFLQKAKSYCDMLIVAVSTDQLVEAYTNKRPVVKFEDRRRIVSAIRYVDSVIPQIDTDTLGAAIKQDIDVLFVGSEWRGTERWNRLEQQLNSVGVHVVYIPNKSKTIMTDLSS